MAEAIDHMRIDFRWEVLARENEAIREHRAKRKAARTRQEKDLVGEWEPERMSNGETKPQIMARSKHILLTHKSKWNPPAAGKGRHIVPNVPCPGEGIQPLPRTCGHFQQRLRPPQWQGLTWQGGYNRVEAFGYNGFGKVIETFENHKRYHRQLLRWQVDQCLGGIVQRQNQGSPHTLQGRGRHRLLHVQACQAIFLKSPFHQPGKSADP